MLQVLSILAILIALGCLIYLLMESLRNWLSAWRQIRQTKKKNKKLEKYRRAEEKRQRSPQTADAAGALMERNEDADVRRDIARVGYVVLFVWEAFLLLPLAWGAIFGGPAWSPPTLLHLLRVTVGYPLVVYLLWRMVLWTLGRFARST